MMKKYLLIIIISLIVSPVYLSAQNIIACTGNNQIASNLSQSYTLGETQINDYVVNAKECSQGFQQPEIPHLNMRLFIQGFYTGGGLMTAVANPVTAPTITDTISISFIDISLNSTPGFQKNILLSTDGWCSAILPLSLFAKSFYLKINHRNTIEIWSKNPLLVTTNTVFDFSTP